MGSDAPNDRQSSMARLNGSSLAALEVVYEYRQADG